MRQPPSQFQSLESSDCQATASLDPQELPLGKQCHGTGFRGQGAGDDGSTENGLRGASLTVLASRDGQLGSEK